MMGSRALYHSLVILLGAYYLAVLAMALNPRVSEWYRRYYLSGETDLTPTAIARLAPITPGAVLSFRSEILGFDGWAAPKKARWSLGTQPRIVFQVAEGDGRRLSGHLRLEFNTLGTQRVQIALNGTPIHDHTYTCPPQGESITFCPVTADIRFPPSLVMPGQNDLGFHLPDARLVPVDGRVLAIAFKSLTLD
ncbi:hypothetical protein [Candidatus Methylocalor cossyra]|uniref:Phosphatidylglycerol/phosphatidylinositol transfer protein n=1 Tax=Candidatus Methylocalor cossyra TaxID=3108543 RepID=A0ABM9NLS7_9GAMM